MVSVPEEEMAPPLSAEFPLKVEFSIVSVPSE
jgi:hypothetical protein